MRFSLIPREMKFFDLFDDAGARLTAAADKFLDLVVSFDDLAERAREMKREEEACDRVIRTILETLNRSFITPFDREDIHALVLSLDDVMDKMEETAHRFAVARTERPTPTAVELARIVQESCGHLRDALGLLRDLRQAPRIQAHLRAISRLENEADRAYRQADAALFAGGGDVLALIKWHELYGWLEATVDATKQVAHIISGIVVKGT